MIILSLLTFGSLFFWLGLLVFSILILAFDSYENEGKAFVTLLIFLGLVTVANPGVVSAIKANPLLLGVGVLVYLVFGVITAVIKWYFFLLNVRDAVNDGQNPRQKYGHGESSITVRGREVSYPIVVSKFKARIIGWMTYWPWVAVWTLLDDPIRRVFQRIYVSIAGQLQKMADKILPSVKSE